MILFYFYIFKTGDTCIRNKVNLLYYCKNENIPFEQIGKKPIWYPITLHYMGYTSSYKLKDKKLIFIQKYNLISDKQSP